MQRVVILGRGASGKSTLAARLGAATGIPVVELDTIFWRPDLTPAPAEVWVGVQRDLIQQPRWIADGDLGPYDVLDLRLAAADTVIMLDFSFVRCSWRAVRRSRERADFWLWLWSYCWRWRPRILEKIGTLAAAAEVHVLRNPRAVERFLNSQQPSGRRSQSRRNVPPEVPACPDGAQDPNAPR